MTNATKLNSDIQCLRAVAILAVVLQHAHNTILPDQYPWVAKFYGAFSGRAGVDLFFAISGFVIASALLPKIDLCNDLNKKLQETLAFWCKRAWRLFPSAWLWLVICLIFSLVFNQSQIFGTNQANFSALVAGMFQVANFRFAQIYDQGLFYGASFVYWSLSLEEQFYLVLPLLVIFARKWLPAILLSLIAIQFAQDRSMLLLVTRTDALLIGVLIALWRRHSTYELFDPEFLRRRRCFGILVLGFLSLGLLTATALPLKVLPLPYSLVAMISGLLVLIASFDRGYLFGTGLLKALFEWVGARSYAMYLIHVPVYFAIREINFRLHGPDHWQLPGVVAFNTVCALVAIAVVSELNYRLVEAPLRRRGAQLVKQYRSAKGLSRDEVA